LKKLNLKSEPYNYDLTTDAFFKESIKVRQFKYGYRFSVDAVLLAAFVRPAKGDCIVDLGTGCGIIPLILAHRNRDVSIYGVEIQKELAWLAIINVRENNMENRIKILMENIKDIQPDSIKGPADIVVANPPYHRLNSGRINPNLQKAAARHEIKATLNDMVSAGSRLLKKSGKLILIYPAERITDLLFSMRFFGIEPKWIRMVHSYRNSPAKFIIIEGIKEAGPDAKVRHPLYIYKKDGSYSKEVEKMFI
jgi:tRNA1Val (adenine37-N6)-methyltransferase